MSVPAPAPLEYQTPQPKEHWLRRYAGAVALAWAVAQWLWLGMVTLMIWRFRSRYRAHPMIEIILNVTFPLPSVVAVALAIRAWVRAETTAKQGLLATIALLSAGGFLLFTIPTWWEFLVSIGH